MAERSCPKALPISLKVTSSAKQAVLFHQNLRQTRSEVMGLHLLSYLGAAHRSSVNEERLPNTKAEVVPTLITIAPVALFRTQKQR